MEDAINWSKLISKIKKLDFPTFSETHLIKLIEEMPSVKPKAYRIVDEDGNMKCSVCGSSECWG